jgi:autotransporter-associated beta strand protein
MLGSSFRHQALRVASSGRSAWAIAAAVAGALGGASALRAAEVTWTGALPDPADNTRALWDNATQNWSPNPPGTFTNGNPGLGVTGDDVVFTDNFAGIANVHIDNTGSAPNSVTFRHIAGTTAATYRFTKAGTGWAIAGLSLTLEDGFLGRVQLANRPNSATVGGQTLIAGGVLELNDGGALPGGSNQNNPPITLAGGTLAINVNISGNTQPASSQLTGMLTVDSDSTLSLDAANASRLYSGSIAMGVGTTLNVVSTNGFRADLAGNQSSTLGGRVLLGANTPLRLNGSTTGSANAVWDLGTGSGTLLTNNAGAYNLGEVRGNATTRLEGSTGTGATTFVIGGLNTSSTFDGVVANGSGGGTTALTKTGTGTLTLTNTNTYTGATNVVNGRLLVNGSLNAASAVTVGNTLQTGATPVLGGTGTVNGIVTVLGDSGGAGSAGHLAPGESVGTINVGGLTLEGGSIGDFEFAALANDLVVVNNVNGLTINGGGINLFAEGTTDPFAGDGTFHLFQFTGVLGGSEDNLGVLNPQSGYTYDFVVSTGPGGASFVDVVVAVPEPTALALAGLSACVGLFRRRRNA